MSNDVCLLWLNTVFCTTWNKGTSYRLQPSTSNYNYVSRKYASVMKGKLPISGPLITERIEYKLLSLTYKVLTTTQPPYLHSLISTQRPRSTRSSSVVTLAQPPSSSSLKIIDRSFYYASHCLWNQLPLCFRQPHSDTSSSISTHPSLLPLLIHHSAHPQLPLSFTPGLKPILFHKSFPRTFTSSSRTAFTDYFPDRFFWATWFLCLVSPYFFVSMSCARLSRQFRKLLSARKSTALYHIVSY